MGLESVFKLSLIMSMVDNLTSPLSKVQAGVGGSVSKLQKMEQGLGSMTKTGIGVAVTRSRRPRLHRSRQRLIHGGRWESCPH